VKKLFIEINNLKLIKLTFIIFMPICRGCKYTHQTREDVEEVEFLTPVRQVDNFAVEVVRFDVFGGKTAAFFHS
jgi:hypothetical protein